MEKPKIPKFIIVTGGVLSGLGKGIATASMGFLISSRLKVTPIKCEGYLNIDPGTMNPIEHGEVFVLDDGEEADMDFGHYERFLGVSCKAHWNITMGKVYQSVFERERRGDFLGKTVQLIPHVTDEIKRKWFEIAAEEQSDIMLVEIGGTVGDIETALHIEAARQLKKDVGSENVLYVHLTYVPIPTGVGEQKSKPTQQSVNLLRQMGIMPDIIIGRCSEMLEEKIKRKIATFCDVDTSAVITGLDVDNVYKMPVIFDQEGVVDIIHKKLGIYSPPDLARWKELVDNISNPKNEVTIAICGKYTELEDSYASVVEALTHAGANLNSRVNVKWVETSDVGSNQEIAQALEGIDGVIVPGGFGMRGTEGKIQVIRYVRENNIPFLGICLGLQLAVIDFARHVCQIPNATSSEFTEETGPEGMQKSYVIDILPEQKEIEAKGGTMRLGAYKALLAAGTLASSLYNSAEAWERHRHRYEVNPEFHNILSGKGMIFSGMSPDGRLVEFVEIPNHRYFIATQAHPELKSTLTKPAPLFFGLVKAALGQTEKPIMVSQGL